MEPDCLRRLVNLTREEGFPDETEVNDLICTAREVIAYARELRTENATLVRRAFDLDAQCAIERDRNYLRSEEATAHRRASQTLQAECADLREQLKSTAKDRDERRDLAYAAKSDADALRAILEGRTTPPTDAEIEAHWRAGGAWLVELRVIRSETEAKRAAEQYRGLAIAWRALDRRSAPCAWPVVSP